MHTNLIVDLNNTAFMIRHSSLKNPRRNQKKEAFARELIFKEMISYITRFAVEQKVDAIAIMCDSPHVWRRDIYPEYKEKAHSEDVYFDDCLNAANIAKDFFRNCTNASVFEVPKTEADDLIALFVNESEGVNNIIMSSDRDFVQLITDKTTLYSPAQKIFRTCEDAGYELFLKCIRGDRNDNIFSAYPRVRETVLQKAWEDPYEMQNLMENVRSDGKRVGDAYDFNKKLIDLTLQPADIKKDIRGHLADPQDTNFSEFKIMRFYATNFLKEYADSLKHRYRPLKGKVKQKIV